MRVGPIEDFNAWKEEALEKIDDRVVVCSISGGKDSTTMALLLLEAGIPFRSVHLDTGWEHKETYKYVRDYLPHIIGEIDIIQWEGGGMDELCRKHTGFPGANQRFCTRSLKVIPMKKYLDNMEDEPINTVGIRSEESASRARMPAWEYSSQFSCEVWRPIKDWTERDVIDMHHRHGIRPNPLYLMGASRVGCWPCIYARKAEIKMISETDPGRIDEMRALEEEIYHLRVEKNNEKGKKTSAQPPTWFGHKKPGWGIDKVVEWSKTPFRGRKDLELFEAPLHEQGCMRWGLCESAHPSIAQEAAVQQLWEATEFPDDVEEDETSGCPGF